MLAEIEASKNPDLTNFLYAIGIRHVGTERARLLAEHFSLAELETVDVTELKMIGDIRSEVASSIHSFFANDSNRETIHQIQQEDVTLEHREYSDEFEGATLVFIGSIKEYSRNELTELMEKHGVTVTSSVSSETDYLVVGDDPGTRSWRSR